MKGSTIQCLWPTWQDTEAKHLVTMIFLRSHPFQLRSKSADSLTMSPGSHLALRYVVEPSMKLFAHHLLVWSVSRSVDFNLQDPAI